MHRNSKYKNNVKRLRRPNHVIRLKNTRASSVPVHGTSLSMHELPSSCKDPNDKAWFERRGYELRSSNYENSFPHFSCKKNIIVVLKLCPCVPHPIVTEALLDGRRDCRLFDLPSTSTASVFYDVNIMITVINDIHVEPGGRTKEREKQCTGQSSSGKILSSRRDYLDQLDDRQW